MKEVIYLDQELILQKGHIDDLSEVYRVTTHERFDLARTDLLERKVDCVVMGMVLPFAGFTAEETGNGLRTGKKVLEAVRGEGSANRETPVVIQASYVDKELEEECMKLGATKYLYKPMFPDELLEEVKRLIGE